MIPPTPPRSLADIDWDRWVPVDVATLLFVVRDGRALVLYLLPEGKIEFTGK